MRMTGPIAIKPALTLESCRRHTIFPVQLLDLGTELDPLYDFIVEFVPLSQSGELWTRKLGDWREIQAVERYAEEGDKPGYEETSEGHLQRVIPQVVEKVSCVHCLHYQALDNIREGIGERG